MSMTADRNVAEGTVKGTHARAPHAPRITLLPYRAAHLEALLLQPAQAHLQAQLLGKGYAQSLEACEAYSVFADDEVIACGGVHVWHPQRALVWALMGARCGRHFKRVHKFVQRWLRLAPYARVEAHVDSSFAQGARWLRLLGFTCETPQGMRGFTPEGKSCHLYARLRGDALPGSTRPAAKHSSGGDVCQASAPPTIAQGSAAAGITPHSPTRTPSTPGRPEPALGHMPHHVAVRPEPVEGRMPYPTSVRPELAPGRVHHHTP